MLQPDSVLRERKTSIEPSRETPTSDPQPIQKDSKPVVWDGRRAAIIHGYRGEEYRNKPWKCFWSLFGWHNETINSWTMIINAAISFYLFTQATSLCSSTSASTLNSVEFFLSASTKMLYFTAHFASCIVHLPFSVGYHLLLACGPTYAARWRALDVSFIHVSGLLLTTALTIPSGMPEHLSTLVQYAALFYCTLAIWSITTDHPHKPLKRSFQTLRILICVIIYLFPVGYRGFVMQEMFAAECFFGILVCLFITGFLYATQLPESKYLGYFDYIGCSHQLLHVAVGVAHVIQWYYIKHCLNL